MPELIALLQMPPGVRILYSLPQFWFYSAEKAAGVVDPTQCLTCWASTARIFFKCLRHGTTDPEAQELMERLPSAKCLAEYESWTTRLDAIQDHEQWKEKRESIEPEYDPKTIQHCIDQMYRALESEDQEQMRLCLRSSIFRTVGNINLLRLYKHCWFGTKQLIDNYIRAVRGTVEAYVTLLLHPNTPGHEIRKGIKALDDCLFMQGHSALCLSGGAALGMKHIGVVKCLWESYLLPRIICGASAGSIVAAIAASSTNDEMLEVLHRFPRSPLEVFEAGDAHWLVWAMQKLWRLVTGKNLIDPSHLNAVMSEWLEDITFKEAYHKTGKVLNITVSRINSRHTQILNHLTAPNVVIRTAVCASCAVPWIFPAATILEKDVRNKTLSRWNSSEDGEFVDGSLDSDVPLQVLGEMWNAHYFIVSQANAHVRLFLTAEEVFKGVQFTTARQAESMWHGLKGFCLYIVNALFASGEQLGLPQWIWRWRSVFDQTYTGDATIYPAIEWWDYVRLVMMRNPTPQFMARATEQGEQATWPKMPRIQNSLAVEEALKKGIKDLHERIHIGPRPAQRSGTSKEQRARSQSPGLRFLERRGLCVAHLEARHCSGEDGSSRTRETTRFRRHKSEPDLSSRLSMASIKPLSPHGRVSRPKLGCKISP